MKSLAICGLFLCIGCAQINVGMDLDKPSVDQIVRGQTTREEVTKILGQPTERAAAGGVEHWTYINRLTSASPKLAWVGLGYEGDVKEKTLTIVFDHNLVKDVSFSETVKPFVSMLSLN